MDVTVSVGNGLNRSPATTVEILDKLAATNVTADNWELLSAMLDYLDIPQKQEIVEGWREKFRPSVPQDVIAALGSDPILLQMAQEMIEQTSGLKEAAQGGGIDPVEALGMLPEM